MGTARLSAVSNVWWVMQKRNTVRALAIRVIIMLGMICLGWNSFAVANAPAADSALKLLPERVATFKAVTPVVGVIERFVSMSV